MRKRNIWILAFFSGLVVTALIIVQLVWIRDAIKLQNKQFDQLVVKTLKDVVSKLEDHETNEIWSQVMTELNKPEESEQTETASDSIQQENRNYVLGSADALQGYYYLMDQSSFSVETKIDLISGDTIFFVSENTLYNTPDNDNPNGIITPRVDVDDAYNQMISSKKVFIEKVFNQMVRKEKTIENRINYSMLDSTIREEFIRKSINLPYEFAVRTGNSRYLFQSQGFNPNNDSQSFSTLLFPRDIRVAPNFLVVYFPDKQNYIFRFVGIMAGSSLALALTILIISFIAIYVIFRQRKLSEIKNDFINNMTHELKTPISTISLASQWLADSTIDPSAKNIERITNLIKDESQRLGQQVERVLQISILEEGKLILKNQPLSFNSLVQKAVEKISLQVEKRQGTLESHLYSEEIYIDGDEAHLTNLIYNLLDNALKYSKDEPWINVTTSISGSMVKLTVSDHGIGIPRDQIKRIFEKFYRVPTGNVHDVKGFGIGLSYVKKVLEMHQGSIEVESTTGKGSTFIIFLPLLIEK